MDVVLARMVMPLSLSISLLSIALSFTSSFSRKVPEDFKSWSTKVVLPWSTCAMMAMLRMFINEALLEKTSTILVEADLQKQEKISSIFTYKGHLSGEFSSFLGSNDSQVKRRRMS